MNNEVSSYLFLDHIILALSKDWLNLFGELPKFVVFFDTKGRLTLRTTKSVKPLKE